MRNIIKTAQKHTYLILKKTDTMPLLCPTCKQEVPISKYAYHIVEYHPEKIEERALLCIQRTDQQVEYIYNKHPEAMRNNGILLTYLAKAYPKVTLTETEGEYQLKAQYNDFFYFLKHANSATRLGRNIRRRQGIQIDKETIKGKQISIIKGVSLILSKDTASFFNDGKLSLEFLRYFPIKDTKIAYIDNTITLSAPKQVFPEALRLVESISRVSRKLRRTMQIPVSSPVPQRRELEEAFSSVVWAGQ